MDAERRGERDATHGWLLKWPLSSIRTPTRLSPRGLPKGIELAKRACKGDTNMKKSQKSQKPTSVKKLRFPRLLPVKSAVRAGSILPCIKVS
jgi:hypothetical protein